jgi:hypothetical protein
MSGGEGAECMYLKDACLISCSAEGGCAACPTETEIVRSASALKMFVLNLKKDTVGPHK